MMKIGMGGRHRDQEGWIDDQVSDPSKVGRTNTSKVELGSCPGRSTTGRTRIVGTNSGVWQNGWRKNKRGPKVEQKVALDLPVDAKKTKRCYGPQAKPDQK